MKQLRRFLRSTPATILALALGCSGGAIAAETPPTPGPQRAQSGVLQPGPVVHAQATPPTAASNLGLVLPGAPKWPGHWKIPRTRLHALGVKRAIIADVSAYLGPPLPDPAENHPGRLSLFRNTTVPVTTGKTGAVSEPSTDQAGSNIFATANYHAEFSKDNGKTWEGLDPFSIFGDEGFCCDQVTVYDPRHNRQHWVLQFLPSILGGPPGARDHLVIANSRGGDFINWCPYTITPSTFSRPNDESLDYNDLVVGSHYLYLTTRLIKYPPGQPYVVNAVALARINLDDLAACKPAHYDSVIRTDIGDGEFGELRVPQGITDVAYAGANLPKEGKGRILRILIWPETSQVIRTVDRPVPPFVFMYSDDVEPNCASEDKVVSNWCVINPGMSASKNSHYLWFSWDAQQYGDKRPFPYTRLTQIRERDLRVVGSRDLYSRTVAHVLASIGVDSLGNVGLVDSFGGGKGDTHYFPSAMLGILEQNRIASTLVDFFLFGHGIGCFADPRSPTEGAWGDYNTIRNWQGIRGMWLATTYIRNDNNAAQCPQKGASVTIKNVVFGLGHQTGAHDHMGGNDGDQ